jgi:hypothetical protein
MAEDRRSAIGGERVGARLGRLFQRSPERQELVDAYRMNIPVDELRRRRAAAAAPAASAGRSGRMSDGMSESAQASSEAVAGRRAAADSTMVPPDEVAAAASQRRAQAMRRLPNTRMSPRAASGMSEADMLNQRELDRINNERVLDRIRNEEREEERRRLSSESAARRTESMGGSGDIGAASARARGEQVGPPGDYNMKKGGKVAVKKMKAGGVVKSSASSRGDGCAARGKTKGRMV